MIVMKPIPTTEAQTAPIGARPQRRQPRVVAVIVPRRRGSAPAASRGR
jgi:hypothetical protein